MKHKLKIIGIIIGLLVVIFGGKTIYAGAAAASNLKEARSAVDGRNWSQAQKKYQKVQDLKPSVESRTALQQLEYLVAGDKDLAAGRLESMQQNYQAALEVDGSLTRINKQINATLKDASNEDDDASVKSSHSSSTKEVSSSKVSSSSSEKASNSSWQSASSNGGTNSSHIDLANAYDFSDSDVIAARNQLKQKFSNVDLYDDNNIKKVMAMSLLNQTSLEVAYQTGGWNS